MAPDLFIQNLVRGNWIFFNACFKGIQLCLQTFLFDVMLSHPLSLRFLTLSHIHDLVGGSKVRVLNRGSNYLVVNPSIFEAFLELTI